LNYLTTPTSLSPIRRVFAPCFVNYKKGCTRLAAASDKAYQFLAHGRWFSPVTPTSSTTKTGRHDIAEILLKVALSTINQSFNYSIISPLIYASDYTIDIFKYFLPTKDGIKSQSRKSIIIQQIHKSLKISC
jgi:hypothetical protein